MTMCLSPVESSVINAIAYDDGDLFVWFVSGRVYVYHDAPRCVFECFERAASKGKFFNTLIKGRYSWDEAADAGDQQKEGAR